MFESLKARISIYLVSGFGVAFVYASEFLGIISHAEMTEWISLIIAVNVLVSVYFLIRWLSE